VASFCREVEVVTALGALDSHEEWVRRSLMPNVKLTAVERPDGPTTRKCRFVDPSYTRKLFEVYFHNEAPFDAATEAKVASTVAAAAETADVVIASDFGHGLISRPIVSVLTERAPFLAVNAQTNAGNQGFNLITKYQRPHYVCLDAPEARLAMTDRDSDIMEIAQHTLPARLNGRKIMITHGQHGCVAFDEEFGPALRIPALTSTIVDTVGAGDAFLAVTAPLVRAGGRIDHIGFIGNAAGAIKVGIVGHRRSVEKVPLLKFLTAVLK
jgi:sugar/nucleoside kinase (ribokinase family)